MEYKGRYSRNLGGVSESGQRELLSKTICVAGCGGLGGYVIEIMARLGVAGITVVDGDVFDETNLNRQLLSREALLGEPKALAAKARVAEINSSVAVTAHFCRLTRENAAGILRGCDLAFDCLDNAESRFTLAEACGKLGIPLVHGAVGGWCGQAAVILPGGRILDTLYPAGADGRENLGNLPFLAAAVASVQCAEAVKLLLGAGDCLTGGFIRIDLLRNEFYIVKSTE